MRRANCSPERLALLGACLLALAGCGVADAAATTVEMQRGNRYQPSTITVDAGTTVVWRNGTTDIHTVTTNTQATDAARVPAGGERWDSGPIEPAGTFSRELTEPGTYVFACEIHGADGMIGAIEVER